MLSLPDMQEKQLLFVHTEWGERTALRFSNENLVFEKEGKVENRASCHKALAVFITGDTVVTTPLLRGAREHGVSLFFLKQNYELYASFVAEAEGHWLLREKQYTAPIAQTLEVAKELVFLKLANQTDVLQDARLRTGDPRTHKALLRKKIRAVKTGKELLGIEGNHTKMYFNAS